MAKLILNDISAGYQSNVAANTNNTLIETALENTLSRDGTAPNQMEADFDMNSNEILNLGIPTAASSAARLVDVSDSDATGAASAQLRTELATAGETTGGKLVAFLQSGTGAVSRTEQEKNRDWINVKDFGAVLDGVTDDTTAITNAWAACITQRKNLFSDGGIALISSTLTLTDTSATWWDGSSTERPIGFVLNSVLKYTGTGPCVRVQGNVFGTKSYIKALVGPGVVIGTSHVLDGAITVSDATLTSASNPFDNTNIGLVGDYVEVYGAGKEGSVLCTTISSITSTGSVELAQTAYTTVTNALVRIIPASYVSYGVIIGKSATVFTAANGADGVDIEIGQITDFDCGLLVNGWNNKVKVGDITAAHTCMSLHSSNCNQISFGNIGGVYLGGGLLASRRERTAVNGIRIISGSGTNITGGAIQYCGKTDSGCGLYVSGSFHNISCYVEGNLSYGNLLHVPGNNNNLNVSVRGSPLGTKLDGVIIEGYGNTIDGIDDVSSLSDIPSNSPSSNIHGVKVKQGNKVLGSFIDKTTETKSVLDDDLITTRTAAGWVPTASLTETNTTNAPNGYPLSIAGAQKSVKLEIPAGDTNVHYYTLATAVSTAGETKTRARVKLLARAVTNSLGVIERTNMMLSVINGAVNSSQAADNTAGKEIYGQYSTRLSSEWELIDFIVDIPTLPATLKVRISCREQNRVAGTAAMEVYFPEPMLTFNVEEDFAITYRSPIYRVSTLNDNASATINADGARIIKFTGTPTITTITSITTMKNSELTVYNNSTAELIVLNQVVRIGTASSWYIDTSGIFILKSIGEATGDPSATAPWSTATWKVGDRFYESTPVVGQPKSWVCTVAGTPGTWVSEGNL